MGCCKSAGKLKMRAAEKKANAPMPPAPPNSKYPLGHVQHYAPGGVPKNG